MVLRDIARDFSAAASGHTNHQYRRIAARLEHHLVVPKEVYLDSIRRVLAEGFTVHCKVRGKAQI